MGLRVMRAQKANAVNTLQKTSSQLQSQVKEQTKELEEMQKERNKFDEENMHLKKRIANTMELVSQLEKERDTQLTNIDKLHCEVTNLQKTIDKKEKLALEKEKEFYENNQCHQELRIEFMKKLEEMKNFRKENFQLKRKIIEVERFQKERLQLKKDKKNTERKIKELQKEKLLLGLDTYAVQKEIASMQSLLLSDEIDKENMDSNSYVKQEKHKKKQIRTRAKN